MKTERRHELQTNDLADSLSHVIEALRPYGRVIAGLCVMGLALVFAFFFASNARQEKLAQDWNTYLLAGGNPDEAAVEKTLTELANEHRDEPIGEMSRLKLADMQLSTGLRRIISNRIAANEVLNKAIDNFSLLKESKNKDVKGRAMLGLAETHETLGDLPRAKKEYETLAEDKEFPYQALAKERAEKVGGEDSRKFYGWLAEYVPPAPPTAPDGATGIRPSFEEELFHPPKKQRSADDDPLSLPSFGDDKAKDSDKKPESDAAPAEPKPDEPKSDTKPTDESPAPASKP